MNLFSRLLGAPEQRSSTLASPGPDLLEIFGALPGAAGIAVNADSALRSPTVLAATRAISETAGMLPIAVRRREGTSWVKVSDHPAARLLNGFANPWTSSEQLRTQITTDAILHRNGGFARVIRVQGEPRELHRIRPSAVRVFADPASGEPRYEVSVESNRRQVLPYTDVMHVTVPGWTLDRPMGLIDSARDAIAVDLAMIGHQQKTFGNGGLPRMFLSPESERISPEALKNALAFIKRQIGLDDGPIILPAAFKEAIKSFGLGEMQFLELRRLVIEDIARALRVPATIIGDLTHGTYSNTEQMGRQFLQLCLLPWLEIWESAVTRCLIAPADRETVEVEFITEDLLRGDTAARSAAYRNAAGGAWLTRNEVRELEGRPPVAGGDELLNQAGQTGAAANPPPEKEEPLNA